jgi:hypothetical protein
MKKSEEMKPCPLCGTMLPYDKWLKVVGVYEEQQKHRKQLETELSKAKEQGQKLTLEYKKVRQQEKKMRAQFNQKITEERKKIKEISQGLKEKERTLKTRLEKQFKMQHAKLREKFEREKRIALEQVRREGIKIGTQKEKAKTEKLKDDLEKIKAEQANAEAKLKQKFQIEQEKLKKKLERERQTELKRIRSEGIKSGIEKQKARTEKVAKMADKYRKARDEAIERAKQLEEMIKKGTTPQIEGFHFERELANQLRSRFPADEVKPTGREGDIIQTVKTENKKVGKIIYECKKTREFQNKFVEQIRRDKAKAIADYAVIVTWATKEDRQGFWVEGDIFIVHPYAVLDIATFLRETLVQMYTLRMSKSEFEAKGKALLEFMQSEEFRTKIQDSIDKSRDAYEVLKKEVKTHVNTWKKRFKIYESIHRNTGAIQNTVRYVLLHGRIPEKLPETKEFPTLPISTRTETPDTK